MQDRHATAAIIGAGDFIGSAVARRFAKEGYTIFAGRRNADKLAPLVESIESCRRNMPWRAAWTRAGRRKLSAFLQAADHAAPLEIVASSIRRECQFSHTPKRPSAVFRKVWEMACYAGFLGGREAARLMLPQWESENDPLHRVRRRACEAAIGYAAFASAKIRPARCGAEHGAANSPPKNIHAGASDHRRGRRYGFRPRRDRIKRGAARTRFRPARTRIS